MTGMPAILPAPCPAPATGTGPGVEVKTLLLSDEEAAGLLGCSRAHFRNLVRLGRAPQPVKLGHLSKWRRREIVDWTNAGLPLAARWSWRPGPDRT